VTEANNKNDCFVSKTDSDTAVLRRILVGFHDYISTAVLNHGQMGWADSHEHRVGSELKSVTYCNVLFQHSSKETEQEQTVTSKIRHPPTRS
jgi:hypothetical protein